MSKKLEIDLITPEPSDGDDLKGYYFQQDANGAVNLYRSNNTQVNTSPLTLNTPFTFVDAGSGISFTLTPTAFVPEYVAIMGSWSDPGAQRPTDVAGGDDETGTFTAQAGVTVDEEAASAAKA